MVFKVIVCTFGFKKSLYNGSGVLLYSNVAELIDIYKCAC